jgi:hypothetical protein
VNFRGRIKSIEKALRRKASSSGPQVEYIISESFLPNANGAAPAGPGISKRNVVFIMPRPGEKQGAETGQALLNAKE